jgi:hypothetical protein
MYFYLFGGTSGVWKFKLLSFNIWMFIIKVFNFFSSSVCLQLQGIDGVRLNALGAVAFGSKGNLSPLTNDMGLIL